MEYTTQACVGVLAGPLALCAVVVAVGFALFALRVFSVVRRTKARLRGIQERLGPLSDEQLLAIMQTPTHPDSQFALVELRRRGVDTRPTKEQLFGMLTSGNSALCGHAMVNLQIFYPELVIPEGASNLDPPELWQSRIDAFRHTE